MVDALLDYMSEIIATDRTITFNNGETYDGCKVNGKSILSSRQWSYPICS